MNEISWNCVVQGSSRNFPLLFLHGFMGSSFEWMEIIDYLKKSYYCLALDLPGHGKTKINANDSCYSIQFTAKEICRFLQDLKIEKSYLIGYSMGGRLALYLAVYYPEYFQSIILESTSPGIENVRERIKRQKKDSKNAEELQTGDFGKFLKRWYSQPLFRSLKEHPKFLELYKQRFVNDAFGLAKSLRFMGTGIQPSLWLNLKDIKIPILILAGEKDEKFGKIAFQMEELIPNCRMHIVKECGHNIHFEKPHIFIKYTQEFLINKGE